MTPASPHKALWRTQNFNSDSDPVRMMDKVDKEFWETVGPATIHPTSASATNNYHARTRIHAVPPGARPQSSSPLPPTTPAGSPPPASDQWPVFRHLHQRGVCVPVRNMSQSTVPVPGAFQVGAANGAGSPMSSIAGMGRSLFRGGAEVDFERGG